MNVLEASLAGTTAQTALGLLELRARAGTSTGPGMVMLRPEQLEVRAAEAGDGAQDGLGGRVEQCRYYGHDALLRIRSEGLDGSELLLARVSGERALPAGTPVRVRAHGPVTPLDPAKSPDGR